MPTPRMTCFSPSRLRPQWCLAIVIAAFLSMPAAWASEKSEALTKQGNALRRAGRDSEAARKLQEAYDINATPRAAAQLGLCLQAIGRWSEADVKLSEAISAVDDPWVRKNRQTLKESLEVVKTHVARVEVMGEPVGATVTVNGKNVGVLPLSEAIPVNEGLVDVELTAKGYARTQRSLTMTGGSYQRLVVRMTETTGKDPAPVPLPAVSNLQAPATEPDGITAAANPDQTAAPKPLLQRPWFWVGVGTVVAAGVVTAILLSGSDGQKSRAFDDSGDLQ